MAAKFSNMFLFLMVHCAGVVLSASYYQREYSGYLFTIPGFNDAERRSQDDARTWCNGNGSKLLAITDPNIQNAAVAFINDAVRQNQMAGNPIITDGRRSGEDWTWINGTAAPTLQIGGQDGGSSYSYASLSVSASLSSFSLYASTPTDKKYFMCEGQVFCGNGNYQHESQCFQSFRDNSDQLSWFEARNRCLYKGGDLATFEFIKTNDGLKALNGSWLAPSTQYWIGLRRQWWTWQSINSNVTYSQWTDYHPIYYANQQQCICLLPNNPTYDWKWSECQCSQVYQFVCISSAGTTVTSTSSTRPTPTPSTHRTLQSSSHSSVLSAMTERSSSSANGTTSYKDIGGGGNGVNLPLAIGLGVGLGGGILLIVAIVLIVFVIIPRKGYLNFLRKRTTRADVGHSQMQPDVVLSPPPPPSNAIYAEIAKIPEYAKSSLQDNSGSNQTPTEYASIEIVKDRNRLIGNYGRSTSNKSNSEL